MSEEAGNVQRPTSNVQRSTPEAALEKFIDGKIPKHLRENYGHDISMIKGGWHAALAFIRDSLPKWRRETPDESGLWWWWDEDEDSGSIPVNIALSGSDGTYFAMAGQYGWSREQPVVEMGGLWMPCIEPAVPTSDERELLITALKAIEGHIDLVNSN